MVSLETIYELLKEFKKETGDHLKELNNKVATNKEWIDGNKGRVKTLWGDRESKFKRYGSLITNIIYIAVLIALGFKAF